jgi:acyl-homoserine-lactone acylase
VLLATAEDVFAHTLRVYLTFLTINGQSGQKVNPSVPRFIDSRLPLPPGSNGWAVTPSHSATGHAMLLANPHLAWSDLYSLFEAHLRCPRAGRDGVPLLGLPVLMIASTTALDGHTVNTHRRGQLLWL